MNTTSNPIFEQATQWLSDLKDGKADSAGLFRWLAESPRHVEEFAFALALTDEIAGLNEEQCAQIRAMNVVRQHSPTVIPFSGNHVPRRHPERSWRNWTLAASGAALAIGIGLLWWNNGWRTYDTSFGEQRVVDLADGSIMHLNAQTRVRVKYDDEARDIQIIQGEALFKVERDPLHPFRVYSEDSVIQAVGTQFNVHRRGDETTVAVLEGSVKITRNEEGEPASSHAPKASANSAVENLSAGQEARFTQGEGIQTRRVDAQQIASWRQHRLVFRNDTLQDIVEEFNRYNRRLQIRIEDPNAARRRFAATFDANSPEALIQVLQTHSDLSVERTGSEIIVRSRALPEVSSEPR